MKWAICWERPNWRTEQNETTKSISWSQLIFLWGKCARYLLVQNKRIPKAPICASFLHLTCCNILFLNHNLQWVFIALLPIWFHSIGIANRYHIRRYSGLQARELCNKWGLQGGERGRGWKQTICASAGNKWISWSSSTLEIEMMKVHLLHSISLQVWGFFFLIFFSIITFFLHICILSVNASYVMITKTWNLGNPSKIQRDIILSGGWLWRTIWTQYIAATRFMLTDLSNN